MAQDTIFLDTAAFTNQKKFSIPQTRPYVAPAILISHGFITLNNNVLKGADKYLQHELEEQLPPHILRIEDKLQYAPAAMTFTLDLLGVKSKNTFIDRSGIYLLSNALRSFTADYLKNKTHKLRPSLQNDRAFPSSHTATAFLAAEFLRQEYKDVSPWYGYTVAAATGSLRLLQNDHWFSDAVAGAGIGILSSRFGYVACPWLKKQLFKNKENLLLILIANNETVGFVLVAPLDK